MALNFGNDMFTRNVIDDGEISNVPMTSEAEAASVTFSGTNTAGALTNMYDYDTTTYFDIYNAAGAGSGNVTWDFKRKMRFSQIYAFVHVTGEDARYLLQGSDNNSDWTTLDTGAFGGTYPAYIDDNLVASNVSYRYIRLSITATSSFHGQIGTFKCTRRKE